MGLTDRLIGLRAQDRRFCWGLRFRVVSRQAELGVIKVLQKSRGEAAQHLKRFFY